MVAPSAPVITSRSATIGSYRLRWLAVAGAATYKVYRDTVHTGQTLTAAAGWNEAVVTVGPSDALTVTAVNAGLEESVASNVITVGSNVGSQASFPPTPPTDRSVRRGPFGS